MPPDPAITAGPLLLGPLIRHIGHDDATIWVETSRPGCVTVRAGSRVVEERTFQVAGHSYAIIVVDGLHDRLKHALRGPVRWRGRLAGRRVAVPAEPDPDHRSGPSTAPDLRVVPIPRGREGQRSDRFRRRRSRRVRPPDRPPGAGRLAGRPARCSATRSTRTRPRRRPGRSSPAGATRVSRRTSRSPISRSTRRLYAEAWGDPDARWLLSVIPSSMMFDDHDVVDDWNTSRSWRREMGATSWWRERITGALMSYWIYQHLGNMSATELRSNDLLARVRDADDAETLLRAFAVGADREADGGPGVMWSYRRDYGRVRLLDDRLALWPRAEGGPPADGRRCRVRLDRGTDRGSRLRPSARRDERAMAPAARPARYRGGRRAADRRSSGAPHRPARGARPARRRPRALGRIQRLVRAARASVRTDRAGRARTEPRRPLSACCPGTSTTPTSARPSTRTRRRRGSIS